MKHEKYKEMLELNILGELNSEEELELENHLFECDECAQEYSKLKKLYAIITTERSAAASDEDLLAARMRLFSKINEISEEPSVFEKLVNGIKSLFTSNYTFAFGSIVLVMLGLFIGYLIFNNSGSSFQYSKDKIIDLDKLEKGRISFTDIRVPENFSDNNDFEFLIGDTEPISYKGKLNDLTVQRMLAIAMKKTENDGFKIRTANTVAEQVNEDFRPDEKIKEAFIYTLKTDKNPGVRKSVMRALTNFPFDEEIRDALLFTLTNDENASNRMDAINTLLAMNRDSINIDEKNREVLNKKFSTEENEVIKYRTTKLLLGGK